LHPQALNSHRDIESDKSRVVALDDVDQVAGEGGRALGLGDFELQRVLGRGAWGKVYRARHIPSSLVFALKALKKQSLIEQKLTRLIITERQLMSELLHPFICTLHGHFQTDTHLYMVLRCGVGLLLLLLLLQLKQPLTHPPQTCPRW